MSPYPAFLSPKRSSKLIGKDSGEDSDVEMKYLRPASKQEIRNNDHKSLAVEAQKTGSKVTKVNPIKKSTKDFPLNGAQLKAMAPQGESTTTHKAK